MQCLCHISQLHGCDVSGSTLLCIYLSRNATAARQEGTDSRKVLGFTDLPPATPLYPSPGLKQQGGDHRDSKFQYFPQSPVKGKKRKNIVEEMRCHFLSAREPRQTLHTMTSPVLEGVREYHSECYHWINQVC